jgi:hypothetical protein
MHGKEAIDGFVAAWAIQVNHLAEYHRGSGGVHRRRRDVRLVRVAESDLCPLDAQGFEEIIRIIL